MSEAHKGAFIIKLSVNGVQTYLGIERTSEEVAARLYDAALFRLLPFTSSRARPNFPEDFDAIDAQAVPPIANKIYLQLVTEAQGSGIDVAALRELREKQIKSIPTSHCSNDWKSKIELSKKFSNRIFKYNIEFKQKLGASILLRKVPALHARREIIMSKFQELSYELEEFSQELEHNAEFLQKMESL